MTVKQLIKYLKKFDQNAMVVVPAEGVCYYSPLKKIEIRSLKYFWDLEQFCDIFSENATTKCLVIM